MDLKDQLKQLFPNQESSEELSASEANDGLWIQDEPLLCKYEKRKGKPITIIDGYTGHQEDFKELARDLKKSLGVGGSIKKDQILIQGDYRPQVMKILQEMGFSVKRVGG